MKKFENMRCSCGEPSQTWGARAGARGTGAASAVSLSLRKCIEVLCSAWSGTVSATVGLLR